ncbi:hypothetical protein KEM60_01018 [Austwickia sp. TVS 96-490-7B]|uniref:DUF3180 domain-containing protein n=1 Tax=Austwickia sp. TVS 96-490-7B TaxID=2830843 RepID=UPI001C586B73|nr:DUF3180 domain-containing protein [Austwickia sp. TVS 96-490-7B]MBW3084829.1 hypothetical protein [Austwickia sp. TVS 96-490-7B]
MSGSSERQGLQGRTIGWAFLLAGSVGYLVQRVVNDQVGRMPLPRWPGAALLVVIMVGLVVAAWPIRLWKRGKLTRRLDPLRAFRTLILARASALAGAVVAGWYAANAAVLAPDGASATVRAGMGSAAAYVVVGAVMVVVGLMVQSWCRIDPPADDPEDHAGPSR